MADERDMDPEHWEHEAAPSPDERLQQAFLAALRRTEAGVAALTRMADSLSDRFPRTRAAVATRLLTAGGARRDVEPLLAIGDLDDLTALLRCLEDATPPPWLGEHVRGSRAWPPARHGAPDALARVASSWLTATE